MTKGQMDLHKRANLYHILNLFLNGDLKNKSEFRFKIEAGVIKEII
jgi:hypothetical protein